MRLDEANSSLEMQSISENGDLVTQKSVHMQKHQVDTSYLILSKNDFGKIKKRINVGYFNKKTNFLVGENHSLLFWDNDTGQLTSPPISEVKANPKRYFLAYELFSVLYDNPEITILDKKTNKSTNIILNRAFGFDIGQFLKKINPSETKIPEEYKILEIIIQIQDGKLNLNKQVLLNSNASFLLGILEGYLQDETTFILRPNINIYNISYILNLLGAQYSIRAVGKNAENSSKHIRFKLPLFLHSKSSLDIKYFRTNKYMLVEGLSEENPEQLQAKYSKHLIKLPELKNPIFKELVNSGIIELIPARDLVFLPSREKILYDFSMERADATNYFIPGGPLAKNSDGDILGTIAISTREAADECINKFSTAMKKRFLDLLTGDVSNWGVKLDSALGLYSGTR